MREWILLLAIATCVGTVSARESTCVSDVGSATAATTPGVNDCGALVLNSDGTYESGYAWTYAGVALPYYGAFAECYHGPTQICAVVCDLTGDGEFITRQIDAYAWSDDNGEPGSVLALVPNFSLTPPMYPTFERAVIWLPEPLCVAGPFWVGFWPESIGADLGMWIGADLNGPGGCPMTNIAPGQGYPTGWQDPSIVWGPTAALGIGIEVTDCPPTPVRSSTWGEVKRLYE